MISITLAMDGGMIMDTVGRWFDIETLTDDITISLKGFIVSNVYLITAQ